MTGELTADETVLLSLLPDSGSPASRYFLQRDLGWDDGRLMEARNRLIDKGLIVAGRGRGGPLRRVTVEPEPVVSELRTEDELYSPMATVVAERWAVDRRYWKSQVVVTARQGRRNTGGTWSRPDVVLVGLRRFAHVPGTHLDVVTFEIKPPDYLDVTAVYEALAHRRVANFAYVLASIPNPDSYWDPAIREAAERHGIGLLVATDASDYATWYEVVRPERSSPDLELLDQFIAVQLPEAHEFLAEHLDGGVLP